MGIFPGRLDDPDNGFVVVLRLLNTHTKQLTQLRCADNQRGRIGETNHDGMR